MARTATPTKQPAIVRDFTKIFSETPLTSTTSHEAAFNRLLTATHLPTYGRPGNKAIEARIARIAARCPRRLAARTARIYVPVQPLPDARGLVSGRYPGSYVTIPLEAQGSRLPDLIPAGLVPTHEQRARWLRHDARQGLSSRARAMRHAAALTRALGLPPKDEDPQEQAREKALRAFAVNVGRAYHSRVASLYQSQRADVCYGRGGERESDNTIYRGAYKGWYASWQHAGSRIEGEQIILENYRGTPKATIPLPVDAARTRVRFQRKLGASWLLLDGDLWAVERHGVMERYGLTRGRFVRTGYAVRMTLLESTGGLTEYWEHGATLDDVRREREAKAAGLRQAKASVPYKTQRMARLIARRCGQLAVSAADARSVGYCDAGIRGFCQRHELDPEGQTTVAQLRSTGDERVRRVIDAAALRCATTRLSARQAA